MSQPTVSQRFWTKAADRLASLTISMGGLLMVGSLVLIFLLIVSEAIPLFKAPKATAHGTLATPPNALVASADEYRADVSFLMPDGILRVVTLADGKTVKDLPVPGVEGRTVTAAARSIKGDLALGLSDGSAIVAMPTWQSSFESGVRRVDLEMKALPRLALDPAGRALARIAFAEKESGAATVAASPAPDALLFGIASSDPGEVLAKDLSAALGKETVTALAFLDNGNSLCVGTASGKILSIPVDDPKAPGPAETTAVNTDGTPITVLETLVGGQTLVAGDARGRVTGLLRVRDKPDAEARKLLPVKTFDGHSAAITALGASGRGKTFVSVRGKDAAGKRPHGTRGVQGSRQGERGNRRRRGGLRRRRRRCIHRGFAVRDSHRESAAPLRLRDHSNFREVLDRVVPRSAPTTVLDAAHRKRGFARHRRGVQVDDAGVEPHCHLVATSVIARHDRGGVSWIACGCRAAGRAGRRSVGHRIRWLNAAQRSGLRGRCGRLRSVAEQVLRRRTV